MTNFQRYISFLACLSVLPFVCTKESIADNLPKAPQSLLLNEARRSLDPWLEKMTQKIKGQSDFYVVDSALLKELPKTQKAIYFFNVTKEGTIENLTVRLSSGDKATDKLVQNLIEHSGPFDSPSNDLPCSHQSGVLVIFSKNDDKIAVSSVLSRVLVNSRIGYPGPPILKLD